MIKTISEIRYGFFQKGTHLKQNLVRVVLLCIIDNMLVSCALFAGIIYPKTDFIYKAIGDMPPHAMDARFEAGDRYSQEITFYFVRHGNDFETSFITEFFVKKPYEKLLLYEMRCEWDTGNVILVSNKEYTFNKEKYRERDGYYWRVRWGIFKADFSKIFRGKKVGDGFDVKFTLRYSFDDEPERTEVLEYYVKVIKGKFEWTLTFTR